MRHPMLDRQITIEKKETTLDATYGTEVISWVPLVAEAGSPVVAVRFWAEIQDVLPSRSEGVQQGLIVGRNQTRLRMRWRNDVDSSMRVTVHGETDVLYQIVAGPAEIGGRKAFMEMVLERYTSG